MNGEMSALGTKQTSACALHMSAFGGKADTAMSAFDPIAHGAAPIEAARQASRIERSDLGLDLSQCAASDKNAERLRLLLALNGQSRRFVNDREQIMATSQSHGPLSISGVKR